ncbi:hypothetical protein OB962_00755 [Aeromonas piscicola]|uniref:Uncharacterized protein n=1 Tax=Aeromonas piscicola TaxID=600645 RepID=A0ABT7Q6H7_9GAMM|nr:hypothetical protein [Aeromonas piscicola]MDM5129534.1 hypothetical protein [Aeromonas piscicola]
MKLHSTNIPSWILSQRETSNTSRILWRLHRIIFSDHRILLATIDQADMEKVNFLINNESKKALEKAGQDAFNL